MNGLLLQRGRKILFQTSNTECIHVFKKELRFLKGEERIKRTYTIKTDTDISVYTVQYDC